MYQGKNKKDVEYDTDCKIRDGKCARDGDRQPRKRNLGFNQPQQRMVEPGQAQAWQGLRSWQLKLILFRRIDQHHERRHYFWRQHKRRIKLRRINLWWQHQRWLDQHRRIDFGRFHVWRFNIGRHHVFNVGRIIVLWWLINDEQHVYVGRIDWFDQHRRIKHRRRYVGRKHLWRKHWQHRRNRGSRTCRLCAVRSRRSWSGDRTPVQPQSPRSHRGGIRAPFFEAASLSPAHPELDEGSVEKKCRIQGERLTNPPSSSRVSGWGAAESERA